MAHLSILVSYFSLAVDASQLKHRKTITNKDHCNTISFGIVLSQALTESMKPLLLLPTGNGIDWRHRARIPVAIAS